MVALRKFLAGFSTILRASTVRQVLSGGHPFCSSTAENVHGTDKNTQEGVSISVPGTKWCGPGNTAANYDDLGKFKDTDICCRDHDHCDNIAAGEEKYGLKNDDSFTRLHCDCDKAFYNCLHMDNSTVSNVVGTNYFLLRSKCYKNTHPILKCDEYLTKFFIRRCIKYSFNTSQPRKYQWFDLPLYNIESYPDMSDEDFYKLQQEHQQEILITDNLIS